MIRTIAILVSLLALTGCAKTVIDSACVSFSPIRYSASGDTPDTKDQIKRHNAAWAAICN